MIRKKSNYGQSSCSTNRSNDERTENGMCAGDCVYWRPKKKSATSSREKRKNAEQQWLTTFWCAGVGRTPLPFSHLHAQRENCEIFSAKKAINILIISIQQTIKDFKMAALKLTKWRTDIVKAIKSHHVHVRETEEMCAEILINLLRSPTFSGCCCFRRILPFCCWCFAIHIIPDWPSGRWIHNRIPWRIFLCFSLSRNEKICYQLHPQPRLFIVLNVTGWERQVTLHLHLFTDEKAKVISHCFHSTVTVNQHHRMTERKE